MTADGIVGKVLLVYPSVSQVLLIDDQSSGVGVILEKSRLQGVLRGTATGEVMLERVMSDEQVPVGETVLTSGGDQIFPKGLPVGTVTKVGNGKDLFLNIKVRPAADLSKLEEVLVLVEQRDRVSTAEDTKRVRAVDILAQRLPSVPPKPAENAKPEGAAGATGATTKISHPSNTAMGGAASTGTPPQGTGAAAAANQTSHPANTTQGGATTRSGDPAAAPAQPKSLTPVSTPATPPPAPADDNEPH
jgi:rod shape-determining protein MreC